MALFSFSGQIISRGKSVAIGADGGNGVKANSLRSTSIAAAAYRSGSRLVDKRSGKVFDYSRKGGVVYTEIMLPPNAPGRYHDRATLWNAVEAAEKQVNSQLSRELRIALPSEFSREDNIGLVRDFVQRNFVSKGMCADIAYHVKDHAGEDHNPHVHIMLTMRPMHKSGNWWETKSKKEYLLDKHGNRIVNSKGEYRTRNIDLTGWNDKGLYVSWRKDWAKSCNELYEKHGLNLRIDHRSYKEQGIDRVATVHLGKEAAALERKGITTEKGEYNRAVNAFNDVAELGVEPVLLRATLKEIFLKAKERQRLSRKARGTEPAGETHSTEKQARSQQAEPLGRSTKAAGDPAGRKSERRTDAPLHGAVRQGDPAPQRTDENAPFSSKKERAAAAAGERSYAQISRSSIRHTEGTQNFLASRGAHSYADILAGCRRAQAEFAAAQQAQSDRLTEIKQLRELQRCIVWYEENGELLHRLERFKSQSSKFYEANREAVLAFDYAKKDIEKLGYSSDITAEQLENLKADLAFAKNELNTKSNAELRKLYDLERCAKFCEQYRESAAKVSIFNFGKKRELAEEFKQAVSMLRKADYNEYHSPAFFESEIHSLRENAKAKWSDLFRAERQLDYLEMLIGKRELNRQTAENYADYKSHIDGLWQQHKKELGRALYAQKTLTESGIFLESDFAQITAKLHELEQQRTASAPMLYKLEDELRMWVSCEDYARKLLGITERPADLPDFSVNAPERRKSELERIQEQLNKAAEQKQKEKSPRQKSQGLER